jgi:hypothetical protein
MLPYGIGLVVGLWAGFAVSHYAIVRKLRSRVAYLETQFKRRFAEII